ncbi:nitroreductase family protein [Candidatus Saccharibacteria bacterium oral taxon 488]|jgi:hypothetical protein|nr:nitroreductase family protein [Candidatus Saccharibacteria bacterium oral taxon 488]
MFRSNNISSANFEFLVAQAVKAPSGHNTQPWKFRQNESAVEIYPDFDRRLPVVDPDDRELSVSLGCAVENLCLAAQTKGYKSAVSVGDKGVITVSLAEEAGVKPSPLFSQIDARQTNRSVYNGEEIALDVLKKLQSIRSEKSISVHYYARQTKQFNDIEQYVLQGNTHQMQNEAFKAELKSWMRFNKKHQDQTLDGLSYAVFGAPNVPRWMAEPIMSMAINAKAQNKADREKIASASHLVLFTTRENSRREWVSLGRTLQRFLLTTTELGIVHAYLNQPNEEVEIALEMTRTLGLAGECPTILLRIGYGRQQAYSKRRAVKDVIEH